MAAKDAKSASSGYHLFMLVLCIYALAVLAAEVTIGFSPETQEIFDYADFAVCGLFFVDFLFSLFRAPNRWRYFISWGWIDLLSSIPMIDVARWGRLARVLRILRVLRGLRATKLLTTLVLRRRAENTCLAACLVALLLIIFCSVGILHFETSPDSNIKTSEDAIWWSFTTITTVGYGDHFPVTSEGRMIAVILMSAGVGLFGTFSGFLAAWFLTPDEPSRESELDLLRKEIADLHALIVGLCESGRAQARASGGCQV